MRSIISINRPGKYVASSSPSGSLIPAAPDAEVYSGKVILVAAPNDDPSGYKVISLQDYLAGDWFAPVYAILYTFLRSGVVYEIPTDEYRVDYIGRVAGISEEFTAAEHKVLRTYQFCGLWKAGQGASDMWKAQGENGGMFVTRNLEYGDATPMLSEDRQSYFRPANDVVLPDSGIAEINGSDFVSSKWELKQPITSSSSRAVEVIQWSGVKADGTIVPLAEYPVARFGVGMVSAGVARLNPDRCALQFNEKSDETVAYLNLFEFSSPVAIDPNTLDLYWLCFGVGNSQGSLGAFFSKTGTTPTDNTLPFAMGVCPLVPCGIKQNA